MNLQVVKIILMSFNKINNESRYNYQIKILKKFIRECDFFAGKRKKAYSLINKKQFK